MPIFGSLRPCSHVTFAFVSVSTFVSMFKVYSVNDDVNSEYPIGWGWGGGGGRKGATPNYGPAIGHKKSPPMVAA